MAFIVFSVYLGWGLLGFVLLVVLFFSWNVFECFFIKFCVFIKGFLIVVLFKVGFIDSFNIFLKFFRNVNELDVVLDLVN